MPSAFLSLRRYPLIFVVKTAHNWSSDEPSGLWRTGAGLRLGGCLKTDGAVRPGITLVGRALPRHVAGRGQLGGQLCKSGRASDSEARGLQRLFSGPEASAVFLGSRGRTLMTT